MQKHVRIAFVVVVGCLTAVVARANVVIETVSVGNPGNAGELSGAGGGEFGIGPARVCGAVGYAYNIGKYEVTAGQYTTFLNAVAAADTYGLYSSNMGSDTYGCRIQRSGTSGSYTYSVAQDWANRPVSNVSYWDACRFTNWLHNNQPTGAQAPGTTETGAYTLNGYNGQDGRTIQRNAGWKWAVTSEDEWYKAAYYNPAASNYYDYPTSSNTAPSNVLGNPTDPGNNATYNRADSSTIGPPYWRTEVGAHENSDSPYGTFDQGGNVWEWNESIVYQGGTYAYRGMRGGYFNGNDDYLLASHRDYRHPAGDGTGFRVAEVPEPASILLMAFVSLGIVGRRR